MIAEFTVAEVTMVANGGPKLRLQPIGEPSVRVVEIFESADDGTLGDITVEMDDGARYVPRPGDTLRLKISKVRAAE